MVAKLQADVTDLQKKNGDQFTQFIRTKENLELMQNEQKLLSEELTMKQNELLRSQRDKLNMEQELLLLRPLKDQMSNMSENQQQNITEAITIQREKN